MTRIYHVTFVSAAMASLLLRLFNSDYFSPHLALT